jgi:hypothetical protein
MTAPLTAEVVTEWPAHEDCKHECWFAPTLRTLVLQIKGDGDRITTLATQLAERDALWMERQREDLHAIDLSIATNKRLRARIAALTDALRHYAGDPSSSGIVARAALTTDKDPTNGLD